MKQELMEMFNLLSQLEMKSTKENIAIMYNVLAFLQNKIAQLEQEEKQKEA